MERKLITQNHNPPPDMSEGVSPRIMTFSGPVCSLLSHRSSLRLIGLICRPGGRSARWIA